LVFSPDGLGFYILYLYHIFKKMVLDVEDMTSWIYFQQNFDAYFAGERFPLPAPEAEAHNR
jgi:hypothetical protein